MEANDLLKDLAIEDLGDFLNGQFSQGIDDGEWKGFSLGYTDDMVIPEAPKQIKGQPCASPTMCGTIVLPSDESRNVRKKCREKMRRLEVNSKFDELVKLLGLSNKTHRSTILHEASTCIKTLRAERNHLRKERERLQQEMSKLATCLHQRAVNYNTAGGQDSQEPAFTPLLPAMSNSAAGNKPQLMIAPAFPFMM